MCLVQAEISFALSTTEFAQVSNGSLPDCTVPLPEVSNDYCQTSNIRCTYVGNKIIDHSDVVGALPVGAATTTFPFST